ncbi:regulatory protein, arsR family [Asanoa hainanensis]|uniref:Regulatory protein, arsR family n=2 Tax=Asanoa hainanensis TaxID=560556 RepID=A0A239M2C6_9ACTN|nr:regulatory protein, arsR family [Asanoa hainanensis]
MLRQRPATLGQLAAAVGSPKGTVGYHVKVLVDAGLVQHSETEHTMLRHVWLTPARARDLVARLEAWGHEPEDIDDDTATAYGILLSVFRADVPKLPREP